jgi:hypothetical protein
MPYDYVRRYMDSAARDGGAGCVLASMQPASGPERDQRDGVVSFARGTLLVANNHSLSGNLSQYFSDRTYRPGSDPFDPSVRDLLGISITVNDSSRSVTVELIARSWGDAHQTLEHLRIEDGVLIGDGQSVGNQTPSALYGISLTSVTIPG